MGRVICYLKVTMKLAVALFVSMAVAKILMQNAKSKDVLCSTCTFLVTELESYLFGGHTEQEAIDYLKSYCDSAEEYLPGFGLGALCKSLIDEYITSFLDGIA